jgi:imidazoleglycerol phosphate dehydratase HisB
MKTRKNAESAVELNPRASVVERNTAETRIAIHLTIEGRGQY